MVYLLGHSTRSLEEFLEILKEFKIELLIDIRHFPTSKKFPWFSRENLEKILPKKDIEYLWLKDLGGFRKGGYEKYTKTKEYQKALEKVLRLAREKKVALMCAEIKWWKCHRRFIADDLTKKGEKVLHIFGKDKIELHEYLKYRERKVSCDKMKYPSYLNLSLKEISQRREKLFEILKSCEICPRKCRVNRLKGEKGFCQLGKLPLVSAFHPHFGEESVLVGNFGSGTIFFTSCNLACLFCQNYEISQLRIGKEISFEKLAQMMLKLQEMKCHNINLVTPTPQVPQIVRALEIAIERGLKTPLVYNTNAYDSVETLKLLEGIIDIYMPDAKYSDDKIAQKYSMVKDYFKIMKEAIREMHQQVGDLILDERGIAKRGLLVRHLVLPNNLAGSQKIFEFLAKEISPNTFLNIMDQYYPCYKAFEYPQISRRITKEEFEKAIKLAKKAGLKRIYGISKFC